MKANAENSAHPESTSTPADPLEAGQSAALGKMDDHTAEIGIEQFCNRQARNALKAFQEIVAEDYVQFMSQQTGIHADYFRVKC